MLAVPSGSQRGARTISLALAAGLVAFEVVLAVGAGAVGIPGLFLVRLGQAPVEQIGGGESVIPKAPPSQIAAKADREPLALPVADTPHQPLLSGSAAGFEPPGTQRAAEARPALMPAAAPVRADPEVTGSLPAPVSPPPAAEAPRPAPVATGPVALPPAREVGAWLKGTAMEFVGGVDDHGRPLYRFEFWLEPPAELKSRLAKVAYDFDAPSATPRAQSSQERNTGFKVRFGGLSCSDRVTVTLTFDDGQSQKVAVDGCSLLS
jgi:hypothetical protein